MKRALVFLANGFEEIEAVTIIDILRRANVEVVTVGINSKFILGDHNINIEADKESKNFKDENFDILILPGGYDCSTIFCENEFVQNYLVNFNNLGKKIAAICAAPRALNVAGILPINFTCYPSIYEQLTNKKNNTENVVIEKNIITSKGPGTTIEFSMELVKILNGVEIYNDLKAGMLLPL